MLRSRAAVALLGLCLFPASAFAQSAGDQQYADPLAGQNQAKNPASSPGEQGQSAPSSGNSGSSSSATPAQSAQARSGPQTQTAENGTLPRTGTDAPLAFTVLGLIAVASGALLRWGERACYGPSFTWSKRP
jgi:LPXTG-motif cell wall-anchored protein